MDLNLMIAALRRESDALAEVIASLERLLAMRQSNAVEASKRGPGRPPGSKNRPENANGSLAS